MRLIIENRKLVVLLLALPVCLLTASLVSAQSPERMWIPSGEQEQDYYVAFRGQFQLEKETEVEIRTLGASWFGAWLDGDFLTEGPARFPIRYPQYEPQQVRLAAGEHTLAFQVHCVGLATRMLPEIPPFLSCQVRVADEELPVAWKTMRLAGYESQIHRINPVLGWIEWCDTRQVPPHWQQPSYDDRSWKPPVEAIGNIGVPEPLSIAPVPQIEHKLKPLATGPLAEMFGYAKDDPSACFFLRDQAGGQQPAQGVWRRYDLGRVRLGKPRFELDLPPGAIVEFAYSETLRHGRVAPYINLSTGPSCNLDHYIARGGVQEFSPLTPRGGRYLEIHVVAEPSKITFLKESFVERTYHRQAEGSFSTSDALLNQIWKTGVATYRACSEDALVDNPTRERGQWTGDVVSVGMDISGVAFSDMRLLRRALVQCAQCANPEGQVAGLSPGTPIYLPSYALQWVDACVHYYELTGDRPLIEQLFPAAIKNLAAFDPYLTSDGLTDGAGWMFVDWGFVRNEGPINVAFNLQYLSALRSMIRWCELLGKVEHLPRYQQLEKRITGTLRKWIDARIALGNEGWEQMGYHTAALSLRLELMNPADEATCITKLKQHLLRCFPNNPDAPRLSAPDKANPQLITPYFAHFAFPPLIERGEMDFILDQYRTCWGWALEQNPTTWVEVFDPRWSQAHQWCGSPTWQLSRYVLGLHPRFDRGENHFILNLRPGSLPRAEGHLPLPDGSGAIQIKWTRQTDGIHYSIATPQPIWLYDSLSDSSPTRIDADYEIVIPLTQKN